jgi:LPXTG-motif cell wall-anchored protein
MESTQDVQGTGTNWVGNLTQLGGVVAPIITAIKGPAVPTKSTPPTTTVGNAVASGNMKLLLIAGVAVVIIGALFFFLRRRK